MSGDYISREAAMPDGFCVGVSCQECPFCDDPIEGGCKVARFIDAIPAADVVEVVRCRECVHWRGENDICKGIGIDLSEKYIAIAEKRVIHTAYTLPLS